MRSFFKAGVSSCLKGLNAGLLGCQLQKISGNVFSQESLGVNDVLTAEALDVH